MIDSFKGEYRFLSNFWTTPVKYQGRRFPSSEHAYQASKTHDKNEIREVQNCKTPGQAKRAGRVVTIRPGWEDVKLRVMGEIVYEKFRQNDSLREKLLATGNEYLVEGNTWEDTYWGRCRGIGENHLGEILMRVREELSPTKRKT